MGTQPPPQKGAEKNVSKMTCFVWNVTLQFHCNVTLKCFACVQSRLDAQQTVNNDAMRRRQEAIARELDNIRRRQQQLEATNERLQEKAIDIRRSLTDLDLTDVQYQQLKITSDDSDVALKDFVAVCTTVAFGFPPKCLQLRVTYLTVFECLCTPYQGVI